MAEHQRHQREQEEKQWTDATIRWSEEEGVPQQQSAEEEEAVFDPFADPDPTETFSFSFERPAYGDDDGDGDNGSSSKKIHLNIQGYKTHSDQVWSSTGLTLWKASQYLCDYMVEHAHELQHKRILELGAGLGLNGLLAHLLAPDTMTDGDTDALVQLRKNIEVNRTTTKVSARQLLWGEETSQSFLGSLRDAGSGGEDHRFEVIIASDIVYAKVVIEPLWQTIRNLLHPDGAFWMAFARRRVPVSIDFVLEKSKEFGFKYKLMVEHPCEGNEEDESDNGKMGQNPDIEDAAGADHIYIYVFQWETSVGNAS
ncbi:MAG: hypothetical protein SGARI_002095 [Bacillariaceae sp.]